MSRRSWTAFFSIIAAGLLLCFGIAACSTPKAVIDSAYDLAGMLASNPRSVPRALEDMGFKVAQFQNTAWESEDLLYRPEQTIPSTLSFGGLSTEDLASGRAPGMASLALSSFPFADDRMVGTSTNNLMDLAGFEKPFYNKRAPDEASGCLVRRLVGRVDEDKAPATYWSIEVYQHPATDTVPDGYSSYYLTAWTEEAAQNSESEWMQEALVTETEKA